MKKETIMLIACIIFGLAVIALFYIAYYMTTSGASCIINPLGYIQNKTNAICSCINSNSFMFKPIK